MFPLVFIPILVFIVLLPASILLEQHGVLQDPKAKVIIRIFAFLIFAFGVYVFVTHR